MPRRKKRAAWASITQVDASTWRIRYWATGPDGYRRRSKTVRGTRLDAERARSELMLAHSEDAPCPTVGEVYERWFLPGQREQVTEGTIRQYESAWRLHIAPTWESVQCDAVRPLAVQQWLTGLGRSAALASMKVLRPALDYAVRYGVITTNPFRERYLLPSTATVKKLDEGAWDESELGCAWRDLMGEWFEGAFLMMAFGGCRVGESLGVMCAEVELREVDGATYALVPVVRQVDKDGHPTDDMKTEQSRRTAIVPGRAGARIAWLARHADGPWLVVADDGALALGPAAMGLRAADGALRRHRDGAPLRPTGGRCDALGGRARIRGTALRRGVVVGRLGRIGTGTLCIGPSTCGFAALVELDESVGQMRPRAHGAPTCANSRRGVR